MEKNVNVYTVYSPTHENLYQEFFKKSFDDVFRDKNVKLIARKVEQHGGGNWLDGGWNRSMLEKVKILIDAINENMGSWFIHADVDILWIRDCMDELRAEMEDFDIAAQSDNGTICFGFFAMRANEQTLVWMKNIEHVMLTSNKKDISLDQHTANETKDKLRWKLLPTTFWNRVMGELPGNANIAHANFIVGVKEKTSFLRKIQNSLS